MKKIILSMALLAGINGLAQAQCEAVASFNETFDELTSFPSNCWNANGTLGMTFSLQADDDSGNKLQFYGFTEAGANYILVSPELSSIDGGHRLTFEAQAAAAAVGMKLQVGTMSSSEDFASFVAHGEEFVIENTTLTEYVSIAIPAGTSHKHVAVKFTTTAPHQSMLLDNFVWDILGGEEPSCEAVSTLNEGFEDFTAFPQNCWSASSGYPFIMFNDEGNKNVTFYALSAADYHYIATPELTTINGEYRLRFKASRGGVPGDVKVQIGTVSDNSDFTTFIGYGEEMALSATDETEYVSVAIPAAAGHKYAVLRFKASADHQSLTIDDIVWEKQPSTSLENLNQITHSLYPNPVDDVLNISSEISIENVLIYDITGRAVSTAAPQSASFEIKTDQLTPGMYFIQLKSGDKTSLSRFVKN